MACFSLPNLRNGASPGPVECAASGGACLLPCDYVAPKKVKHHRHHKKAKAAKKEMKKEDKK